ncbi:MAG: alanine racemase [Casimicrobiaceae bacterium]
MRHLDGFSHSGPARLADDGAGPADSAATGQRASWVEIDSAAIRHNLGLIRRLAGLARVYAVCKGDAYGFDALTIARFAAAAGIDALACGDPVDARCLRNAGVKLPILLYGSTAADQLPAIAAHDVIVTAHDAATLATCLAADLVFSVKLDTGFNRLGFREEDLDVVVAAAARHPRARVHGAYTHLTDYEDPASVALQASRFDRMTARLHAAGWQTLERMIASSRTLLAHPELVLDAVNPGRLVYGILEEPWDRRLDARSALAAVKARVIALKLVSASSGNSFGPEPLRRDTLLAVIPFGFADGYPRLPAGGEALVRGQRVPLLGLRHTEHCMLDLTDVPGAALGDEVVLLGTQGDETIGIHDLVARTGIPLIELVPRLARNPRRRLL